MAILLSTDVEAAKTQKPLPRVITSFNAEGYKVYGKAFVESWVKYWPKTIGLIVYYEGEDSDFEMTEGVSWHPIETVEFCVDYLSKLSIPIFQGLIGDKFDMWFDARMSRKVFMQMHTCRKYGGKVFWVDADSESLQHVPESFLDACLPDEKFSCYLGRHTKDEYWYHTETGFLGFNANHRLFQAFAKNYIHAFISGTIFANQFFGRPGWNDCVAYDICRHLTQEPDEFVNLSAGVKKGHMHPWAVTKPLCDYITHYKGNRKETRKLRQEDL